MKIDSYIEVERQYEKYIDLVLPTPKTQASRWIYLEARGADGGRRYYNDHCSIDNHYGNGGEGATLGGWAKIEDDAQGCIPFGSTIRFIIGQKGKSYNSWKICGAGGGGGTSILFLPPNAGNGKWQHLIIAGAGGGAYAGAIVGRNGVGGRAYVDCTSGEASTSLNRGGAAGWKYGISGAEPGWHPNNGDWANWVKVDGKLKDISVAEDGTVWGVGLKNEIYRRKDDDSHWDRIPGSLVQISHGSDSNVWGINSKDEIYSWKADSSWKFVEGLPSMISISADSTAWCVNSNNEIYCRKDNDSNWMRMPGSLVQISHGSRSDVWGVNSKDKVYRRKADNSGWQNISGLLKQVTVAADGTVCGVNGEGEIYRRKDDDSGWKKMISYHNVVFKAVSAGSSTNVWALDKNGDIYYCNGSSDIGPG
ncbi:MAG: hypothetical protein GY746_13795, partial [Gammaproteobacteria bacterium]|nr:hypothetical protein [Gammaproteobacteria bacterium]